MAVHSAQRLRRTELPRVAPANSNKIMKYSLAGSADSAGVQRDAHMADFEPRRSYALC